VTQPTAKPGQTARCRWPWWGYLLLAVVALAGYAISIRHTAVLGGLLSALLLSWSAEQAEAAWRTRPGTNPRPIGRPARAPGLVVWVCVLVGLTVVIWPHLVP